MTLLARGRHSSFHPYDLAAPPHSVYDEMSANDAARVTQTEFESKLVVDIKTEAATSATERTPFLVSDILTSTAEEEGSGIPMAAAAAANGFEAARAAEVASGVAEPEDAMATSGGAERNAGYAAAAAGSPGAGEDGGGGELGA